jgi:hypothetical protein
MSTTTQIRINKSPKLLKQIQVLEKLYPTLEVSEIIKLAIDTLVRTTTPSAKNQLLLNAALLWQSVPGDSPKFKKK